MSKQISKIRLKINSIDKKIISNLNLRDKLVKEINLLKSNLCLPINDKEREFVLQERLNKLSRSLFTKKVYNKIFHISKSYSRVLRFGLIGSDINNSLSPIIHDKIANIINIPYQFDLITMKETELDINKIKDLITSYQYNALFITMPYKKLLFPICDMISSKASIIGNINLIYYDGINIIGDNTDYDGFNELLLPYLQYIETTPYILGDGCVAQTIKQVLLDNLFANPIYVSLNPKGENSISYNTFNKEVKPQFIINATPIGNNENNNQSLLDNCDTSNLQLLLDVTYLHKKTKMMTLARESSNGLKMLIYQAIAGIDKVLQLNLDVTNLTSKILEEME